MEKRIIVLSDVLKMKRTINFSDLPSAADAEKVMPKVYQEIQWNGMNYLYKEWVKSSHPKSGYLNAFIANSSSHIAFFKHEGSLSAPSTTDAFNLVSITACAAWNDGLELTITGYRRSIQTDTHTVILLFDKPQMILLQWESIDKVIFKSSGGTVHPESGGSGSGSQVVLTQLTLI